MSSQWEERCRASIYGKGVELPGPLLGHHSLAPSLGRYLKASLTSPLSFYRDLIKQASLIVSLSTDEQLNLQALSLPQVLGSRTESTTL